MVTIESITIHKLCYNVDDLSEPELVSRLRAVQINPAVLSEREEDGLTLLHFAVRRGRSPEFCRVLHELNATLVRTQNNFGRLPIHSACHFSRVETTKYLFELYPDSINIATDNGEYPLHFAAMNKSINENEALELISFLLRHDKGAVQSTRDSWGELPLHWACHYRAELAVVRLLFDAHPDGIFCRNNDGYTPMDVARSKNRADIVHFFETQLGFYLQAQRNQEPDSNGQLPIHRALQNEDVSLGAIKLMVSAHPASLTVADAQGYIPLHLACQFGRLDIVKYVVKEDKNSLTTLDNGGNLPLHHACLAGKPGIVNHILKTTDYGVSMRNNIGKGKLPIQLFLFDAVCDRDLQHMDAFDSLLRADPISLLAIIVDEE